MKKFTLFITALFFSISLFANTVSKKESEKLASNYYKHFAGKSIVDYSIENSFSVEEQGLNCYYVFNFKSGGFVIVSADDAVTPILGYSFQGEFKKDVNKTNISNWLQGYRNEIKFIIENKIDNSETLKRWINIKNNKFSTKADIKNVDPLITSKWGQSDGFDKYCPSGTPVGCVATAMAQIMNYHEFPETGVSWHAYNHLTYGLQSADFSNTNYDWANMLDNSGSDAIAILMRHCGVSVNMNYGPDGSGASSSNVPIALSNYFKYSSESINSVDQSDYSDTDWFTLLKEELDHNRPILYSGQGNEGAHAFVCDGYKSDSTNYFHFNWGWNGYANGFYVIGSLNPENFTFNDYNSAIIGIEPSTAGEEKFLWTKKFSNFPNESTAASNLSAVNSEVAWAIGRDGSGNSADYKVYTKTTNGGATWESNSITNLGGTAFSMICGVSDSIAYIAAYGNGADNHIFRTTDGGDTWASILNGGGASSFFNVVHFFDKNNGFVQGDPVGNEFELYTTTDGGDNWTIVPGENIPDPESSSEYGTVGFYDAVGNTIWFTTNNGYIYKSIDKGLNWNKYLISSEASSTITATFSDNALNGVAIVPTTSGSKKYSTVDGGQTWTELISITGNFYNGDVCAIPSTLNSFVSVGSDWKTPYEGISYSTDGGQTWTDYANYYKNFQFTSIDMVSETNGFAGGFSDYYSQGMYVLGEIDPTNISDFYANKKVSLLNEELAFTNNSFGEIDSVLWNFGEGAIPATAKGLGPHSVTYQTNGFKTVSLTSYKDCKANTQTKDNYIFVSLAPVANFTFTCDSTTVNFTNTSTNTESSITYYDWNFGDDSEINHEKNPIHTYSILKDYDVKLTVYNSETIKSDTTIKISVNSIPTIDNNERKIVVYPNPTNDIINISNASNSIIYMYDIQGRLIDSFKIGNTNSYPINISNYKAGSYILKIIDDNIAQSKIIYIE